jgi:hypothetical protein
MGSPHHLMRLQLEFTTNSLLWKTNGELYERATGEAASGRDTLGLLGGQISYRGDKPGQCRSNTVTCFVSSRRAGLDVCINSSAFGEPGCGDS